MVAVTGPRLSCSDRGWLAVFPCLFGIEFHPATVLDVVVRFDVIDDCGDRRATIAGNLVDRPVQQIFRGSCGVYESVSIHCSSPSAVWWDL